MEKTGDKTTKTNKTHSNIIEIMLKNYIPNAKKNKRKEKHINEYIKEPHIIIFAKDK